MRTIVVLLVWVYFSTALLAQLPNTNIYLFEKKQITDSIFLFSKPQFITAFNMDGYNNQPHFVNSNELYITAQMPEDSTQTDIYALNLTSQKIIRVTNTPDSEYSPILMPNRTHFSCIRVENDGENTQRVWHFPLNRSNNGEPIFPLITDVGYHHWINDNLCALFIVDDPHYLILADKTDQSTIQITSKIGRCFQELPNGNVALIQKLSDKTWQIRELNLDTYKTTLIVNTLEGSEDFVCFPDGTFMMAKDSKLYKFNKEIDKFWVEIADFSFYGIRKITRLAVGANNKIALVTQ